MAKEEHVKMILEDSQKWSSWRSDNPDIRVDLSDASLFEANLHGTDLTGANLRGVNLSGANLYAANLSNADLTGANLSRACLMQAELSGASLGDATLGSGDLTQARLSKANLDRANLRRANLTRAHLNGANLRGADLENADLTGASLRDAHLGRSILVRANLKAANLSGADLTRASLRGADLTGADLSNANLSRISVGQTIFGDNDLSSVKGLETAIYESPSILGVETLFKSAGNIPEVFLRGVGLPETLITYLPSLIVRPIDFYSCFISYSHSDKSFARRIYDALQGRGIRCWLDEHELLPGDKIYTEVDRGIRLWDKILLCCSKDALTSWWVDNEIKIAFDKEQHLWRERGREVLALIPLNLDDYLFSGRWQSGLATEVKARLAAHFHGWEHDNDMFEKQFERLVRALRTNSGGKEPPPPKLL